jgi:hypothetical protein
LYCIVAVPSTCAIALAKTPIDIRFPDRAIRLIGSMPLFTEQLKASGCKEILTSPTIYPDA